MQIVRSINNRRKAIGFLAFLALVASAATSQAAVDAAISGLITDAESVFTLVKGTVIAVLAFMIAIKFAKKVKGA